MVQSDQAPSQPEDASPPFDKIVWTTLKSVRLWATYLGAIFAFVVAYNRFGSDLGIKSHLAIFAGCGSFPATPQPLVVSVSHGALYCHQSFPPAISCKVGRAVGISKNFAR